MAGFNYMIAHKKVRKEYNRPIAPLYALVYGTRSASAVVFLLLIGFLLQPIQQAYAADEAVALEAVVEVPVEAVDTQNVFTEEMVLEEVPPPTTDEVSEAVLDESVLPLEEVEVTVDEVIEVAPTSTTLTELETELEGFDSVVVLDEAATTTEEFAVVAEIVAAEFSSTTGAIEENIASIESSTTSTVEVQIVASTTDTVEENIMAAEVPLPVVEVEILDSENSTSTENVVTQTYATNENQYTFNKNDCVSVGGGSYQCSTDSGVVKEESEQAYSVIGNNGNLDIFIKTSSGEMQITDNYYDDSAPKYDLKSERVVWQRLIDGRYQIILYDLKTKAELQLTSGSNNSMEPSISGKYVVWQQWSGSNWEIILYDGVDTTRLTDNDVQDLVPVIEDSYVLWTAVGSNAQLIRVYSLETGTIQTITNHEGGEIVNPRFVLVYDTKFDNGDVVTRGFDPETGLSSELSATPVPLPINIPPADSTGETRALIQNKQAGREDFSSLELDDLDTATSGQATTTPEITQPEDLVVTMLEEAATSTPLVLTEYDLLIVPYESTATSTQE